MIAVLVGRASGADLGDTKTVYLLPMGSGLDQFLAIRLTTGAQFQVVTDPQKADAVLTDRIGASFEQKLDELYTGTQKKEEESSFVGGGRPATQSISRGKGAIFLVDRKTRNVLWSTYAKAKNATPDEMHRLADRIAGRLEKDRKGK
jgi:hypothetical protein